jgi:transposase-like protein
VRTDDGAVEIDGPRDRNATFEPQAKRETRLDGFDDKIISLHARGMAEARIGRRQG